MNSITAYFVMWRPAGAWQVCKGPYRTLAGARLAMLECERGLPSLADRHTIWRVSEKGRK